MNTDIFAECGIEQTGPHTYRIIGRPYTIRFVRRGDDGESLWECDCPAGKYGHMCKHMRTVTDAVAAWRDEIGFE